MIQGPIAGGSVRVKAPLVFVGYGMKDAAVGYDDYHELDVRGKIAVVLFGSPMGMDSEVGAHLRSQQRRVAAEHGAVAIISVMTRATAAAFPWQQVIQFSTDAVTTWVQKDGTPFDAGGGSAASAIISPTEAALLFEGSAVRLAEVLDEADKPLGRPKGFGLKSMAEIAVATRTRPRVDDSSEAATSLGARDRQHRRREGAARSRVLGSQSSRSNRSNLCSDRPRHANVAVRLYRRGGVRGHAFGPGERPPECGWGDGSEAIARSDA